MKRFSEWRKRTADSRSIGLLCLMFAVWGWLLGVYWR